VVSFLGLVAVLGGLWLGLSGHYTPLITWLGALSVILSSVLAVRLRTLDADSAPFAALPRIVVYWVWLMVEIIKANWVVIKACLRANLDINPALVKVKTACESDLAKTTFANSITLTPGTVSVLLEGDKILVHALYEEGAQPEAFDKMDRLSKWAVDVRGAA